MFFPYGWINYSTYRPGAFRLVPAESEKADWQRDYDAMRGEMFFGEVPSFAEILRIVGDFERQFNEFGGPCRERQSP